MYQVNKTWEIMLLRLKIPDILHFIEFEIVTCAMLKRAGKIVSFKFYPKAVFFECKFRHCSRSKLTDWTSEGWIEDKMKANTH